LVLFNRLELDRYSESMGENIVEELLELKTLLTQENVSDVLVLVEEMTKMSKDDKINKVYLSIKCDHEVAMCDRPYSV